MENQMVEILDQEATSRFVTHQLLIGRLVTNLISLEGQMRISLYQKADPPHQLLEVPLNNLKAGDLVPENALTDYCDLKHVIARYNKLVKKNPELFVDAEIATLRDAIAHGRVFGGGNSSYLLFKFKKPRSDGRVKLEFLQELTPQWLEAQIARVIAAAHKVAKAMGNPLKQAFFFQSADSRSQDKL
jgi:hypothetical protein